MIQEENSDMKKNINGKTKAIIALSVVLVLTLFFGIVGVTGLKLDSRGLRTFGPWLPTTDASQWPELIDLGLDLRGGVYVEYSAKAPENSEADFESLLQGTMTVIQNRLTDAGYAESTVQKIGTDGIRVEIPTATEGAQDEVAARNAVLNLIGETAKLEFRDSQGNVIMDGSMVETAVGGYDSETADYVIAFTLTSEGSKIFADATSKMIGQTLAIYLDDEVLIQPTVQTAITGGSGQISHMGSLERAQTVAAQIQSGALPMELTQQKVDTVSATLGPDALSSSVLAAIIGILIVMAIMIIRYRLNGVLASWALCIYIIILFMLIAAIPGIQLTLPGLAGIVLGIGMAVDANVIIFERFNEEIRAGRALRQAVRAGFKNALSAIVDANVTTLIAALVLLVYGTGSIQGFAKTLLLGVITSMFTAVVVTRFLMKKVVSLGNMDTKLFCASKAVKEEQ